MEEVPMRIGNIYGSHFGTGYAGNVWDKDSVCPTHYDYARRWQSAYDFRGL
jgi:hypothetical protein